MSAGALTQQFLQGTAALSCTPRVVDVASCALSDVDVENCTDVSVLCANKVNSRTVSCSSTDLAALAAHVVASAHGDDSAVANTLAQRMQSAVPNAATLPLASAVHDYVQVMCNPSISVQQNVSGAVKLKDCSNDTVTLLNGADANAMCIASTLGDLLADLPPPLYDDKGVAAPLPTDDTSSNSSSNSVKMVICITVMILVLLACICGAAALGVASRGWSRSHRNCSATR